MNRILIFSNREQIGDGIIKLPFIHAVRLRFPEHYFIWMTNSGTTVYNNELKKIANEYIDEIYENIPLKNIFLKKNIYNCNFTDNFDIIIDTQKAFIRSLALKQLKTKFFISSSINWLLSDVKPKNLLIKSKKYYLEDLFLMLDLVSTKDRTDKFKIKYPHDLIFKLDKLFDKNKKYLGFAPGSATKERIWDIQNFIDVAKHFNKMNFIPTFFLGPEEKKLKNLIQNKVPNVFFPEDLIEGFSGPEVVMATSNYLVCSLGNDAGTTQMLSCGKNIIIKLIGPSDSQKFTPNKENFYTIDSKNYGGKNINLIPILDVIKLIEKIIL